MRATVPTAAVGASATLRLSALMGMMQEIASLHAERLGVGYHAMLAQRRGFVLSRLQMEFCGEWPRWGDELLLRTWPRGIERLFALREFVISRSDGTVFMRASTGWAVIDVDKVRLIRPDDVLAGLLPNPETALSPEAPERLKWADEAQVVDSRPARPSDLDPNRHVNNTRYGDWISDVVAVRLGIDMPLRAVSINYLSEVRLGEQVRIAVAGGDGALTVQGSVETGETPRRAFVSRVRA